MEEKNTPVVEEVNPVEEDKKRKQKNMMIAAGVSVLGIAALAFILRGKQPPPPPPKEEIKIEKRDTIEESWVAEGSKKLEELQKKNEDLEKKLQEVEAQKQQQQQPSPPPENLTQIFSNKPPLPPPPQNDVIIPPPPPQPQPQFQQQAAVPPVQVQPMPQAQQPVIPPLEIKEKPKPVTEKKVVSGLISYVGTKKYEQETSQADDAPKKQQNEESQEKKEERQVVLTNSTYSPNQKELKTIKTYIPAGTITPAVILSGIDVPSGGGGITGPIPVLLKLQDLSILPNKFKSNVKECFIIGTAIGDLRSERAYIRTETLSCVREDQKVIEKQITGYIAGEDGKAGVVGRVVTKAGSVIARSLLAGFIEGVARAFSMQSMIVTTSPLGSTQIVNPDQAIRFGTSQGVTQAATKLVDYYLNLANQLIPVIEINAGRKVDVIFLKGVQLDEV